MKSILILFILNIIYADTRIINTMLFEGKSHKLYISPGKPLYVEFPCPIKFVLPGTKTDLEIKVGIQKKDNITFWSHSSTDVIGVNVKCGNQMFVLDLIPNSKRYYSYVKYSEITFKNKKRKLIADNLEQQGTKLKRKLITSSNQKESR